MKIGRVTAAIVAIAATLPYLTLKLMWLTGSSAGVADPALMHDATMVGLNTMTFAMDAVALLLCLAFTMRWGMRLPAWLVLLPLWVGTGLLSMIVVVTPVQFAVNGAAAFETTGPIAPWVYAMVYGGFVTQGVGLMVAFVLYARDRWPLVFTTTTAYGRPGPTRPFQLVVAWGSLAVATVVGVATLVLASGVMDALRGVLAIAAGVGLVAAVRGRGRLPYWIPVVTVWIGAGSMFAWSLYLEILLATGGPLGSGALPAPERLVGLFAMLTGLVMGLGGAFHLAERSGVGDVQAVQQPLEGEDREGDRQAAHHGHG
ncbi:MAG: hypothetical protein HOY71_10325 [Nonomuraea sp.]|nr:hypothetical protein [Nonomuraea sp.]